jgi:3-dehydroquinate synthase
VASPDVIRVPLPAESGADRSYDIVVGSGTIALLGDALRAAGAGRAAVIADSNVVATHARAAGRALDAAGLETNAIVVPAGESSKSIGQLGRLWEELAGLGLDRHAHLVAVGGGVVGDLAGFAAATFLRGIPVWQVPTTVVAQVDSAIGGKTGINLDAGKNLVGAFWQPRGVFSDVDSLATLPDREFRSGLAEVVKYGIILDAEFIAWLEEHRAAVLRRDAAALMHMVARSATLKADVVARDERELTGLRAVLNYGHTFGHAYETALGYGTLLHGEAVAIGMTDAAELAVRLGRIPRGTADRQRRLLEAMGLPVRLPAGVTAPPDVLLEIMARDKKARGGKLRYVLPSRIGDVELVEDVPMAVVRGVLGG